MCIFAFNSPKLHSLNSLQIFHGFRKFKLPITPYYLLSDLAMLFLIFHQQFWFSNLGKWGYPVFPSLLYCSITFFIFLLVSIYFSNFLPHTSSICISDPTYFFFNFSSTTQLFNQSKYSIISFSFSFVIFFFSIFLIFDFDLINNINNIKNLHTHKIN